MSLEEIIYIIGLLIIGIAIYSVVLVITMKRNVKKVVKIFEEKNALSSKTAIDPIRLGIWEQDMMEKAFKKKDNRHLALKFLLNGEVILITVDGNYYLNKDRISAFKEELNFVGRMMIPNIND